MTTKTQVIATLEQQFYELMISKKYHVSTAESCTGGMLASRIINVPGASNIIEEAFITYSNQSKIKRLSISEKMFEKHGAVSGECVKEMAENLHKLTNCELTIALSGIAGPTGGTPAKPVGTVWFGFYFKEQTIAIHKRFSGTRDLIRKLATEFALQQAIEILNNHK